MEMRVQTMMRECVGRNLVDPEGDKIGTIKAIYVDNRTAQPEWFAVSTGWFGNHMSFVPTRGTDVTGGEVASLYSKDTVKESPHVEPNGSLTSEEQRALFDYYELNDVAPIGEPGGAPRPTGSQHVPGMTAPAMTPSDLLRDDPGDVPLTEGPSTGPRSTDLPSTDLPSTDEPSDESAQLAGRGTTGLGTPDSIIRSEEELSIGRERHEAGQARVRKIVETEHQTVNVPVTHERAYLEREPITDPDGDEIADLRDDVYETTLFAEEPVVEKRVLPKERVFLRKETVTEDRQIEVDVRKERIEIDGDIDDRTELQ